MKYVRTIVSSIILSSASALSWAQPQPPDEHNTHHPDVATTGQTSIPTPSNSADNALLQKDMDMHMKAMQALHEKLQKANPNERQALMSEHQNLMQEGMKMMGMASAGMQGMGMMNNMQAQTKDSSTAPCGRDYTMMLKRMDMMQSMMQMMIDRMAALPTGNR